MTWLIKPFIAATVLAGLAFLAFATKAEHASFEVRVFASLFVGSIQFLVWALIIRGDMRRSQENLARQGQEGEDQGDSD